MPTDARLRESLQRAMSAIETDTEYGLRDARRRGHRRLAVRCGIAAAAIAASIIIVTVAAPHILDLTEQRQQPASIPPSLTIARSEGIVGTWRGEIRCRAFVRGFEKAGIPELAARWLVNDGLQRGPVPNGEHPCRGAEGFTRTHTFRPNGFVQTYQDRRLADDCRCYETLHGHTFFVIGKNGDRIATLRYRVEAGTLTFQAVMPNRCDNVCMGHLAWAVGNYAVIPWHRVA